jgi:hypothetical protein
MQIKFLKNLHNQKGIPTPYHLKQIFIKFEKHFNICILQSKIQQYNLDGALRICQKRKRKAGKNNNEIEN